MPYQNNNAVLSVTTSGESFDKWIDRSYVPPELRSQLEQAQILLVPVEGHQNVNGPVFPRGTNEWFAFLQDRAPQLNPEICVADDDYVELGQYSEEIQLVSMVVLPLAVTILGNLISEFILRAIKNEPNEPNITLDVNILKEEGEATKVYYKGPAALFDEKVLPVLNSVVNESPGKDNR